MRPLALAFAGLTLLAGCAHRDAGASWDVPRLEVPFFPDGSDQCGPSALASVLTYWGRHAQPADLRRELYQAKLRGTLPVDLLLAARARGLKAEMTGGSLETLRGEIDAGRPVIAFVNFGFRFLPVGHFMVVTGYDDARGGVIAHSGKRKNEFLAYRRFQRIWDMTGRWALLASLPS
ncbi:MAG: C39 family peptidase [Elusimicrobiota bacterium]|nr:C39 family peptidase [Elusimicrobiota bacterium]